MNDLYLYNSLIDLDPGFGSGIMYIADHCSDVKPLSNNLLAKESIISSRLYLLITSIWISSVPEGLPYFMLFLACLISFYEKFSSLILVWVSILSIFSGS